jgi:hypothetical protein
MNKHHYNTLVEATQKLRELGFKADLNAIKEGIENVDNKKVYSPKDVSVYFTQRFEGMTNPADSSELLALEMSDGTKGLLVVAFGAKHSQNAETIQALAR